MNTLPADSLSHRPAVNLNTHRKSGNEIEEGSETKRALDQAYTKVLSLTFRIVMALREYKA